ncbi:L-seryl-tRNA(Sec) selenium transferase [Thermodesulfatator autotrophicus]|uniref:L-seryl-tRNA(Sec) selenium transferase n=1 Tax=Thermodesulfatator autotrophicus TaxID=1795632 RepID=A0A177E7T3_9BACT|nr:L-seryl-tRNA(Sec) selenium transferase [Thermodesulfatator autotrophicus]OAG28004.1 L-seryl-tRNA(Sec) selenium transferase [Thermodesulfatator autotrophicus]
MEKQDLLASIPPINEIKEELKSLYPKVLEKLLVLVAREAASQIRQEVLAGKRGTLNKEEVLKLARKILEKKLKPSLVRVINATGVVVHTNLGRSPLAREALEAIEEISAYYSNLEYDLATGKRGSRYVHVEEIVREITGAEAALVVNNNAAAVLLTLNTLALGKEVIVSRGELVEIGGAFRIPDVMARSGAILREVGATNRTHLRDYEEAINENTALLLKVHKSNYALLGFTKEVSGKDLVELGRKYNLPVVEDLGSGCFVDLSKFGLPKEPTVQEVLAAGIDVVTFSGDKLLGGPQAGIIVGRKELIHAIRKNPLNRAVRIDKMTIAGLEATLRLYRDEKEALFKIPTLHFITLPPEEIKKKAIRLKNRLRKRLPKEVKLKIVDTISRVGGGAMPLANPSSYALAIETPRLSASRLERSLRNASPPIIGRIEDDLFLLDMRTVFPEEIPIISEVLEKIFEEV